MVWFGIRPLSFFGHVAWVPKGPSVVPAAQLLEDEIVRPQEVFDEGFDPYSVVPQASGRAVR